MLDSIDIVTKLCRYSTACLQCMAEAMLARTDQDLSEAVRRDFDESPLVYMVGKPSGQEIEAEIIYNRRTYRLTARLALLEPHECGKDGG